MASLLYPQNGVSRAQALSLFRGLLGAITKDAAMMHCLNTHSNHKRSANENSAYERFELFTPGKGRYTEQDFQEAARVATGSRQTQFATDSA